MKKTVIFDQNESELIIDLLNRHASRLQDHYETSKAETKYRLLDKIKTIKTIIKKLENED
jgi:hypothetical protein